MNISALSINFTNNDIEKREKFSFTGEQIIDICQALAEKDGVSGCAAICTCNRTEIFVSCAGDAKYPIDEFLFEYTKADISDVNFEKYCDNDAVRHIMELACGLKSQIMGESQIVGQINDAIEISREAGTGDAVIDTLFRTAVAAGKSALTGAKLCNVPQSSGYAAIDFLKREFGSLEGKSVLVIGNGNMGKIVQRELLREKCCVYVTLREYKKGNNETEKGSLPVKYSQRYDYISLCDIVISATRSPHFTLTADKFFDLCHVPDIVIDLAVPRDVDPEIRKVCTCINIDELGYKAEIDSKSLKKVQSIISKYTREFCEWENYRLSIPYIEKIKSIAAQRIMKSGTAEGIILQEESVEFAVEKAVGMLLGAMKGSIYPDNMKGCMEKLKERARL